MVWAVSYVRPLATIASQVAVHAVTRQVRPAQVVCRQPACIESALVPWQNCTPLCQLVSASAPPCAHEFAAALAPIPEDTNVVHYAGKRLEESKKINQSLSALGNVIAALTDHKGTRAHIPYRSASPSTHCCDPPHSFAVILRDSFYTCCGLNKSHASAANQRAE